MEATITYRGRVINQSDIALVRRIISANPCGSRRFISQELCRAWNWRQANGVLKDMVCRSLLLLLESKGWVQLPPPKRKLPNPLANRKPPDRLTVDQTPIHGPIGALFPIHLEQVRRSPQERLCNSLISQHHYLGYNQPVGEHLKYVAFSHGRPIACLLWSSAPWYIGARDRFIGWNVRIRKNNLRLIAYQSRFLILPWVQVPHLASHLLALSRRCISRDWENIYAHPIHLLETFVDPQRFRGTCYKADNWHCVGKTTGRGKLSESKKAVLPKKAVYVYPLSKDFRRKLCQEPSPC